MFFTFTPFGTLRQPGSLIICDPRLPRGLGACPSHRMGRAHGACESQARREEETMWDASLTTRNEAWGRNPHAPGGFVAARGRLRRCHSSAMTRIDIVAA